MPSWQTVKARLRRLLTPPRKLKFTREGKYFVALTFGIGFAAINTGNNLLYLLLGMMLSLIVGSGVLSELSLRRLTVERKVPDRIFAGHPFLMGIALTNPKERLPSFSIEVEEDISASTLEKKCYFLKVPAGRTQVTSYRHTFQGRGLYRFAGFKVSTRFPFTFFRKSRTVRCPDDVVVLPAIHSVIPPGGHATSMSEQHSSRLDRQGEFFALREYQEGDDPRDIHWRKSAKQGRMMVRQLEDLKGQRIAVFLDNLQHREVLSPSDMDQQERAVSLAASLTVYYVQKGFQVSLVTRSSNVRAGTGQVHLTRLLRELALVDFISEARPFAAPPRWPGECIFVSSAGCSVGRPPGMAA